MDTNFLVRRSVARRQRLVLDCLIVDRLFLVGLLLNCSDINASASVTASNEK